MKYRLQYLRAVAAVLVVIWHASYHLWDSRGDNTILARTPAVLTGAFGVTLFFVISGYLMARLAVRGGAGHFMLHRLVRIYPIYWIVVLGYFIALRLLGHGFTLDPLTLALMPGQGRLYVLGTEWTLPFELSFYFVVFVSILARQSTRIPLIAGAWLILVLAAYWIDPTAQQGQFPEFPRILISIWTLPFVLGLLLPFANRLSLTANHALAAGLVLIVVANCLPVYSVFLLPIGAMGAVYWAVCERKTSDDKELMPLKRLGDWSYALYLSHVPIMLAVYKFAPAAWSAFVLWCLCIALSLVAASLIGTIDLRLYRLLKNQVDSWRPRRQAIVGSIFPLLLALFGAFGLIRAHESAQLASHAEELGRRIAIGNPGSEQALRSAALGVGLTPDMSLLANIDKRECRADGELLVNGWAVDRTDVRKRVALLFFVRGQLKLTAAPMLERPDVLRAVGSRAIFVTPGFDATIPNISCKAGCPSVMLLIVSGGRFALHSVTGVDDCHAN